MRKKRQLLFILYIFTFILRPCSVFSQELDEYQIKAAFLYNFGKFVEWLEPFEKFKICILGSDPFGKNLERSFEGKTIKDKQIEIKRTKDIEGLGSCQIVFISNSEKSNLGTILEKLSQTQTLTVGESSDFNSRGGLIQFLLRDNKIRFNINMAAGEKSKIKISSQLLKLSAVAEQ